MMKKIELSFFFVKMKFLFFKDVKRERILGIGKLIFGVLVFIFVCIFVVFVRRERFRLVLELFKVLERIVQVIGFLKVGDLVKLEGIFEFVGSCKIDVLVIVEEEMVEEEEGFCSLL